MNTVTEIQILEKNVEKLFEDRLTEIGMWPLYASRPTVLQMNLGYRCNQQCAHCHIEAGPHRTEMMSDEVIQSCLDFADEAGIKQFDLTGGAPELHPGFEELVLEIRKRNASVIDRCNLTILSEPGQEGLAEFLADNKVDITASLPHFNPETTNRIRGKEVYERSIIGLKKLNSIGYGMPGNDLVLTIVYNPSSAILPGEQDSLERDFRTKLRELHGIEFTNLITMANMPVGRFLRFLDRSGNLKRYMRQLENNFNVATLDNLMCRYIISVAYDGTLYDCDFNQCMKIAIQNGTVASIRDTTVNDLINRSIRCMSHCYGCTAGQGSGCGGAVTK